MENQVQEELKDQEMLESIMKKMGWTQAEMGEKLGVGQSQVSQYLSGASKMSRLAANRLDLMYDHLTWRGITLHVETATGGKGCIVDDGERVSGGADSLSEKEMKAFRKAELQADYVNGNRWKDAIDTLKTAGFEILYEL